MERYWFVICTKQKQEKKISILLSKKKIENFCPHISVKKKKGEKIIVSSEPLFGTYIFVYITKDELLLIKKNAFVVSTLYWKSNPVVIQQEEIDAIKMVIENYNIIQIKKAIVKNDIGLSIAENSLKEKSNNNLTLIKHKGIVINLPSLGYAITAGERSKQNIISLNENISKSKEKTKSKFSLSFLFNF